ncbi:DUF305 domain-containing protein [Aquipuribacter hungaricus]
MSFSSALRPRVATTAAVAALALTLTACGGSDDNAGATAAATSNMTMESTGTPMAMEPSEAPMAMESSEASVPVDAQFLTAMVPHHQSASEMAQIAVERVQDPEVKALAQRIIDTQTAEIAQMTEISTTEYGTTPPSDMMAMSHDMMGMTMTMDMAADMAMLESSATPDVTFLQMMIPHHASALMMADEEVKRGTDDEVKTLAEKIKSDQANEIGEMQQMLERLA